MAVVTPETVAVYSDWDHIDSEGRRTLRVLHPRSHPSCCRTRCTWGRCYLARTDPRSRDELAGWHAANAPRGA
jgi:hypothetical protein